MPDDVTLEAKRLRAHFNIFPIRYYEPGTTRVAQPNAGPPITLPRVLYVPNPGNGPRTRVTRTSGPPYVKLPPVTATTSK